MVAVVEVMRQVVMAGMQVTMVEVEVVAMHATMDRVNLK
jgi:hypothetical protein